MQTALTTVEGAGVATTDAAVTVMATACWATDWATTATDWATTAPETLAMLTTDEATEVGHVMVWLVTGTGHDGQWIATVVKTGGGGAGGAV